MLLLVSADVACLQDDGDSGIFAGDADSDTGDDGDDESEGDACGGVNCDDPPSPCFVPAGTCSDGKCDYEPALAGTACEGGGGCGGGGYCDAQGNCIPAGNDEDCTRPHATGRCTDGGCGDWVCEPGWDDCDQDWDTGCEIPVGQPHQCSALGLDPDGCWTAHCGNLDDPAAMNFETFYCHDCSTCRPNGDGQCQWCDHDSGTWFETEACGCGMYEDVACFPDP